MTAASAPSQRGSTATPTIRLDAELFDRLTRAHGADNDVARGKLLDLDRATLRRWREGTSTPGLEIALHVADVLGTSVDKLFPRVAA